MSREISPVSHADSASEVGAIEGRQPRPAERQRGRWNFLTWSFFLAEVAAGAQFLGTGAKAAESDGDAARSKAHSEADATFDGVLGNLAPGLAAADDGEGSADASQPKAQSETGLNLLDLQQGDEPGAPLGNAEFAAFPGASSSGSGTSGSGSNGTSQAGSGGSPGISNPPPGASPPISDSPPGGLPPDPDSPPPGGFPPIAESPPPGGLPPDPDSPLPGGFPPISDGPSFGLLPSISVGGTVSVVLDTTLDQLSGLPLVETVGGLLGDVVDGTLGQITGLVGNVGELSTVLGGLLDNDLNLGLSATDSLVTQAIGSVASSVGALVPTIADLGLLGDIGPDLTNAVKTSDIPAALDIVSDVPEIIPLTNAQAVSPGGTIAFPDLTNANVLQVNELFAGGQYTDYGLTMQSNGDSGATTIADTLTGGTDSSTLNSPVDSPTDSHESVLSPGVPDVNASSVNLPSIIDELGVRDLSI
jgi:hypothetical protein